MLAEERGAKITRRFRRPHEHRAGDIVMKTPNYANFSPLKLLAHAVSKSFREVT